MRFVILLCCAAAFFSREALGTIVKLDTPIGSMTFQLYDDAKPVTVANFLSYITSGRYENSFAHRLPQGFVLQGGGFTYTDATSAVAIPTFAPIASEEGPFPAYSNVKGTIAMALSGTGNDTATSSWFINLKDNDGSGLDNLDTLNGGFTVFGSVIAGLDVLQAFAGFTNFAGGSGTNVIVDLNGGNPNAPFANVPITKIVNNTYDTADFIYTTWSVIPEPGMLSLLSLGGFCALGVRRFSRSLRPIPARSPDGSALR
ncbi:MAG: peptidylprolyl isomerase [Chthoniobacterales bacterium]